MQTRIQLTITDEDKDALFDKQLEAIDEISILLNTLPFEVELQVFEREPNQTNRKPVWWL
tara:strand:- start:92 stop:271 length:180 start_codon:yes stop_codon:yes gene_type:complete